MKFSVIMMVIFLSPLYSYSATCESEQCFRVLCGASESALNSRLSEPIYKQGTNHKQLILNVSPPSSVPFNNQGICVTVMYKE